MTDQPVVLAVATYAATADADHDFDSACLVGREGRLEHVAAAVLEKGADGRLEIRRHDSTAEHLAFPGALLGGAITVIAPPLGIAFLAPVLPTRAAWAAVGAIVAQFWHHIPRDTLRRLSDLLESGQAALVVVAVNHTGDAGRSAPDPPDRQDRHRLYAAPTSKPISQRRARRHNRCRNPIVVVDRCCRIDRCARLRVPVSSVRQGRRTSTTPISAGMPRVSGAVNRSCRCDEMGSPSPGPCALPETVPAREFGPLAHRAERGWRVRVISTSQLSTRASTRYTAARPERRSCWRGCGTAAASAGGKPLIRCRGTVLGTQRAVVCTRDQPGALQVRCSSPRPPASWPALSPRSVQPRARPAGAGINPSG